MTTETPASAPFVTPEQLCVGLYIHLDLAWTEHPFTFSSFKIKSQEQIATLRALGLTRIRYNPERSDCAPASAHGVQADDLSMQAAPQHSTTAANAAPPSSEVPRMRRLADQRAKARACQQELLQASRTVKSLSQEVHARPGLVRETAERLIEQIASSMLVDADVSIQLMADKLAGEDLYSHALNVSLLSMMLAKEMHASPAVIRTVGLGALFHDIGELEIPDRILRPTAPLTRSETALLHMHCDYGVTLGRKMNLAPEALQVIAQHHEKVDGSGYPKGLTAAQMSLSARIVSLVNAYEELCNPPNPAQALTPHEALSTLYGQQGAAFDALAMSTFVRCMGVYPPGTIVVLSDSSTAMVVSVNTSKPLRPVVLVHDAAFRKEEALLLDLEAEPGLSITRTLRPQQLAREIFDWLAPRQRMTYYFDTDATACAT
ncbi:MAG: DUF3391 domain-containing protein [Aquabacterium sp.]